MFYDELRTQNIKAGDEIQVFNHAHFLHNKHRLDAVVLSVTKTGRIKCSLEGREDVYTFAKCGRGMGDNPFTIRNKYLTDPRNK